MIRKWLWIGFLVLVSPLLAQTRVQGATGGGIALSEQGQPAEFRFAVVKRTSGDEVRLEGRFLFHTANRERQQAIEIAMGHVRELSVDGNAARFAGPAIFLIRSPRGLERIEGTLSVRVVDRRHGGQGDPDLLALRFVSANGNFVFEYAGGVVRGDIAVFTREEPRCVLEVAQGMGVALSEGGQPGGFLFDVHRLTCGDQTRLEGRFLFHTANRERQQAIEIAMGQAREFGMEGNAARFAGPAIFLIRSPRGLERIEGTLSVRVVDRRHGGQGDPDLLALRFVSANGNFVFEYAGGVVRGDIAVFRREQ